MIGQTISHYKILEKLGEGGMGAVYKAEDLKLKRTVAIKFLPQRLSLHREERERFLQEAQAASALNHPNICVIYEIDEANGETFLVMELVDGVTLRDWIRAKSEHPDGYRKLGLQGAVNLAIQIAEGLEKAHEKGIIHRDIKSENIMVTTDGRVKIMDFGLAKLRGVSKLTKTGSTVGTVAYMSPEQAEGIETDHRTDIFSFGVLLYEMLSGQLPFRAEHETAMIYEIINVNPPSLSDSRKGIDADLDRIVMKCLEKDREVRYQSMKDVAIDLKRYRRDSEGKRIERKTLPQEAAPGEGPGVLMQQPAGRSGAKWLKVGLPAFLSVLLIGAGIYFFLPQEKPIGSIAVLPFANVGADPNTEYLSDGITENIINSMSQLGELRVIPRSRAFRYKGREIDPQEVGKELNVRSVLMGRLVQRADSLNIQMELVDVERESQLWGEQYSARLSNLPAIQQQITKAISSVLRPRANSEELKHLAKGSSANAEAFQSYLKGRYYWNKRSADGMRMSVRYFEEAIGKDPAYGLAYAGLADAYDVLGEWKVLRPENAFPKARSAATKALEIDDSLAEAHTSLASVLRNYDWNWPAAEREYKRAIELNPNYPTAHHWYAEFLMMTGRSEEAFAHIRRAQELDPLSLIINSIVGWMHIYARQYDKTIEECRKVLDMDSNYIPALNYLEKAYWRKGMYGEAVATRRKLLRLSSASERDVEAMEHAYKTTGLEGVCHWALRYLESSSRTGYVPHYKSVRFHVALGENAKALEALERGFEGREVDLTFLKVDPDLDNLRSDPRFIALMKKVGLEP